MNYIIDGYNLGHKLPKAASWLKQGDTDKAITIILNYVQAALSGKGQIIVVFDGQAGPHAHPGSFGSIRVKFSRKPQTADDIIREFIRSHPQPGQWTVISSDNEILYTAKDMGAKIRTSQEFAAQSRKGSKQNEHSEKYDPGPVDVDAWLKLFKEEGGE